MALPDHVLTTFVDICAESLEAEDRELREAFQGYSAQGMYGQCHHGIWNLLEGHKLHTVYRALLDKGFPLEITWEGTRPRRGRADFILSDVQSGALVTIEAKDLKDLGRGDGRLRPVRDDIAKMQHAWPPEVRKFCLVFWHASSEEKVQTAIPEFEHRLPVRFHSEWQRTFPTWRYLRRDRCQQDGIFCMTLLEVADP
jgi:DNA polymerase IIIc chi subunit